MNFLAKFLFLLGAPVLILGEKFDLIKFLFCLKFLFFSTEKDFLFPDEIEDVSIFFFKFVDIVSVFFYLFP